MFILFIHLNFSHDRAYIYCIAWNLYKIHLSSLLRAFLPDMPDFMEDDGPNDGSLDYSGVSDNDDTSISDHSDDVSDVSDDAFAAAVGDLGSDSN